MGMGMTAWEWGRMGTGKAVPAHLYFYLFSELKTK